MPAESYSERFQYLETVYLRFESVEFSRSSADLIVGLQICNRCPTQLLGGREEKGRAGQDSLALVKHF